MADERRRRVVLASALCLAGLGVLSLALGDSGLYSTPGAALSYLPSGHLVKTLEDGTEFTVAIEHFDYTGQTGNYIDDWVYYVGAYEHHVLRFMRDVLTQVEDGVALDVGANVGLHSQYVSPYAKTVHAIEPWPPVLVRLDAMIAANKIDNIAVHRVGYAEEPGSLPFFAPDDNNLGKGSFDETYSGSKGTTEELPLVVGDAHLVEVGASRIDLIKIDIEGYERYAMRGLRQTVERDKPVVVLEVNATEGGFRSEADLSSTFPSGYAYYRLTTPGEFGAWSISLLGWRWVYGPEEEGIYTIEPYDMDFEKRGTLIAVHEERSALLEALSAP